MQEEPPLAIGRPATADARFPRRRCRCPLPFKVLLPSARGRACDGCAVSTRTARGLSARQSDHAGQQPHHAALGQQQRQLRSEPRSPAQKRQTRVKCPFFEEVGEMPFFRYRIPWNHLIERQRACSCSQVLKRVSVAAFGARSWYLVTFSVLGVLGVLGIFVVAASLCDTLAPRCACQTRKILSSGRICPSQKSVLRPSLSLGCGLGCGLG